MRKIKQLLFAPPEYRRFQHRGKRQIVLGCREKPQQRAKILDGKLCPDLQPVDPGNGKPCRFAGPDDLGEKI